MNKLAAPSRRVRRQALLVGLAVGGLLALIVALTPYGVQAANDAWRYLSTQCGQGQQAIRVTTDDRPPAVIPREGYASAQLWSSDGKVSAFSFDINPGPNRVVSVIVVPPNGPAYAWPVGLAPTRRYAEVVSVAGAHGGLEKALSGARRVDLVACLAPRSM